MENQENGNRFKCNLCDNNFETDADLKLHQTSHVKPHTCIHCNKEFSSKSIY